MILVTIYLTVLLSIQIIALSPYCEHKCSGMPNTMCIYPPRGVHICSKFKTGLSAKQKELLLNTHNKLRQTVALGKDPDQPSASNMMAFTWDIEGAEIAQRWAEQCDKSYKKPFEDKCRTKLDGVQGGQNLCVEIPEKLHTNLEGFLTRRATQWFLQGKHFQFKWKEEYLPITDTESYSQIVWASTSSIGCGLSYNDSDVDSMYRLVCNYYPAGNVDGQMVYKKGLACAECPKGSGCSRSWPGLCTTVVNDMGGQTPPDAINTEGSAATVQYSFVLSIFGLLVFCLLKL